MSHQMSDLAVFAISEEISEYEGHVYLFPVGFFKRTDGKMTWRGVDQIPPGTLVGIGLIGFVGDNDGSWGVADEWPLEIIPAFVQVDDDLFEHWDEVQWDDHYVNWTTNGHGRLVAAQYRRAVE